MGYYIGIDCSSRSVHFVVLDVNEKIILMDKCVDASRDIEARFNSVCTKFSSLVANLTRRAVSTQQRLPCCSCFSL